MYTYSFEKLEVWNESKEFTKSIYTITSIFPDQEKFGLISQLRRAAVSICSNIAEGSARSTYKDKAHFTTMAFSSAIEGDGVQMPKGLYRYVISAADGEGKSVKVEGRATLTVSGIRMEEGQAKLLVGDLSIDPSEIIELR